MKKIITTLLILFLTFGLFAQMTEEEKRAALFDLALKHARTVNNGYVTDSDSGLTPFKAFDQIKIDSMQPEIETNGWFQVRTDWTVIDTIKGDQLELLLISYKKAVFYIAISDALNVTLNPDKHYLDYKEKCRLVYLDDKGIFIDEYGKERRACRFMFAEGWGDEATIN